MTGPVTTEALVERLARTICRARGINPDAMHQGSAPDGSFDGVEKARAAPIFPSDCHPNGQPWHFGWRIHRRSAEHIYAEHLAPLLAAHQQVTAERDDWHAAADSATALNKEAVAVIARLRAEGEAKDRRIADLSETWTDEAGTVWSPPTAWAYAKACAALRKHRADGEALREALTVAASRMEVASMDWGIAAALNSDKLTHADDMEEWAKHARTALARAATAREGQADG